MTKQQKEKKERTPWQKVVRGFWITLAAIGCLITFFFVSMIPTEDDDRKDITDNQEYVVRVTHEANTYTYYCTGYKRNIINSSFILIDYKGNSTDELVVLPGTYFRISKNPEYKEDYFQKSEDKETSRKQI